MEKVICYNRMIKKLNPKLNEETQRNINVPQVTYSLEFLIMNAKHSPDPQFSPLNRNLPILSANTEKNFS